jgi:hypothetical protein
MSTGIGKHKYSEPFKGAYSEPKAICPYCSFAFCEADYVDVGIGVVQCGPYYCPNCKASEISSRDKRKLTEKEEETGWYEPFTKVSETANTIKGVLVDHKTAKIAYENGLLD